MTYDDDIELDTLDDTPCSGSRDGSHCECWHDDPQAPCCFCDLGKRKCTSD